MDRPIEIAFHNLHRSESLEAEIRTNVEKLETRYGRMIGCRVSVESLHQQHQTGNSFEVHITFSMPGQEIVVSHEPHHAKERRAHPDARSAMKEAFKAAERQLEGYKTQKRVHEKAGGESSPA